MATSNDTPDTITIQLTRGQVTVIDAIDSDLCAFKWHVLPCKSYANKNLHMAKHTTKRDENGKQITVLLHRVIGARIAGRELTRSDDIDHINGNPLDNRRSNLRVATRSQNAMNTGRNSKNTSGYKGVHYHKNTHKWIAKISINGKQKHLGCFLTAEEAYKSYCTAAKELRGEFANIG